MKSKIKCNYASEYSKKYFSENLTMVKLMLSARTIKS